MSFKNSNQQTGVLYIVATPIGNLDDITIRAIQTLKAVDYIAAEDTRHSKIFLENFSISTPVFSYHKFNEASKVEKIRALLNQGYDVALISDAGTPIISDPGNALVSSLREQGYTVTCVPGACAAIAGLSISGLNAERFHFEGFLPSKGLARVKRLETIKELGVTAILYESPRRLLKVLEEIISVFGEEHMVCVARELTKKFESVESKKVRDIYTFYSSGEGTLKGECVVIVQALRSVDTNQKVSEPVKKLLFQMNEYMPGKEAARQLSEYTGLPKNLLYKTLLQKGD